ncbi:redoxin domain-containing protein [Cellulomonas sp. DKR-3]|uniref:Redoxin domain-containing protein n=1 Tax=Cellulomonas fulva TaxID=2835530 RepID=A0ABS5U290_9CELL|nr:redoxin domain-containing protein [Cellulomonas fulva]MBT0995513.1 redoxin domain-containing protein [Cellulomonas fulva]
MNRLLRLVRRGYVEAIAVLALVVLVLAVVRAVAGSPGWLVAALPWLVAVGAVAGSKLRVPAHPERVDHALVAVGATSTLATALVARSPLPVLVAAAGVAALVGYQRWYSRQHVPAAVLEVGRPLPDFPLQRTDGSPTTSAELREGAHVIVFFRGSWCPFCVAQVRAIAEDYRELDRLGVRVALISPQRPEDTAELASRFDVPMAFYVDADGRAARRLDLVQAGGVPLAFSAGTDGDSVVPTVVITDDDGRVVWVHHAHDHRVRPEPSTFLEVIEREGIRATR